MGYHTILLNGQRWAREAVTQKSEDRRRWPLGLQLSYGLRPMIALARNILLIAYHLLGADHPCEDLGADYFLRVHAEGLKRYLIKRLERLGHRVVLTPRGATA